MEPIHDEGPAEAIYGALRRRLEVDDEKTNAALNTALERELQEPSLDDDLREYEIARRLVGVALFADRRSLQENARLFSEVLTATNGLRVSTFEGRVRCQWGKVLLRKGNLESAIEQLAIACKLLVCPNCHRERAEAAYHLARAYLLTGRKEEAMATLDRVIKAHIHDRRIYDHDLAIMTLLAILSWSSLSQDGRKRAKDLLKDALARGAQRPNSPEYRELLLIRSLGFPIARLRIKRRHQI